MSEVKNTEVTEVETETVVELTEVQVAEAKAIADQEALRVTQIASLNKILAKFATDNDVEIGEVTLQKNDRISASFLGRVNTPSERINASDLSNFTRAKEKFDMGSITLGEKFEFYGSIKPKSNHVKVSEFEVVSARPNAKKGDVITIERIENGVRTNVSISELDEMKSELVLEELAWVKNGTHAMVTEGEFEGYIMPITDELDDVEEEL